MTGLCILHQRCCAKIDATCAFYARVKFNLIDIKFYRIQQRGTHYNILDALSLSAVNLSLTLCWNFRCVYLSLSSHYGAGIFLKCAVNPPPLFQRIHGRKGGSYLLPETINEWIKEKSRELKYKSHKLVFICFCVCYISLFDIIIIIIFMSLSFYANKI